MTAARAVAGLAAALGLLGFVNSFRAVARAAQASFGELAPTVPLGIDLAIAVFSAMDIVLARLDMRPRWVRLVPWSLTAVTIYLNAADQPTWFGRVAHAVFPALWVVAVSLAAHVIRVRAQLTAGTAIDRIRVSRWLLAPLRTALLWRRMVLWEIRSYPDALARERARLLALTGLQDTYGVLAWRWRAPRRVRALYRLGELSAGTGGCPRRRPRMTPDIDAGHGPGLDAGHEVTPDTPDTCPDMETSRRPGRAGRARRTAAGALAGDSRTCPPPIWPGSSAGPSGTAPPDQEPAHRRERARALTHSSPGPVPTAKKTTGPGVTPTSPRKEGRRLHRIRRRYRRVNGRFVASAVAAGLLLAAAHGHVLPVSGQTASMVQPGTANRPRPPRRRSPTPAPSSASPTSGAPPARTRSTARGW